MKQSDPERGVGAKAPGFSDGQFGVAVHGLDDSLGDLLVGLEPVEDQLLVGAQRPRDSLERGQATRRVSSVADSSITVPSLAISAMTSAHTHFVDLVEPLPPIVPDHRELGLSDLGQTTDLH